jgi:hypothetical protein
MPVTHLQDDQQRENGDDYSRCDCVITLHWDEAQR